MTENYLRMVGPLGENFGRSCVSGVPLLAPIARGKEAGINLLIEAHLRQRIVVFERRLQVIHAVRRELRSILWGGRGQRR